MSIDVTRRSFLTGPAGVAGALTLSPLLRGLRLRQRQQPGANSKSGSAAALPGYVPNTAVAADIPSVTGANGAVTAAGFLKYPASPVKTVQQRPRRGRQLHRA